MAFLSLFLLLYVRLSKHWNLFQACIGESNLVTYHSNNVNRALELLDLARAFYSYVVMYQNDSTQLNALVTLEWGQKLPFQQEIVPWWGWSCTILVFLVPVWGQVDQEHKNWSMEGFLLITVFLACREINCLSITVYLYLPYVVIHYLQFLDSLSDH